MDSSKAKKAVKKSTTRKKQAGASAAEALLTMHAAGGGAINPEVQAGHIDLQPADGYVNPYHAMGPLAPTSYAAGNMLAGYNYPVAINPET